jgi:predicted aspartyl protease
MKLEYRNGLLFTNIEIIVNDNRKIIDNIVVDTGAAQTVISQECVEDIGISFTGKEEIVTTYGIGGEEHAFVKEVDEIVIGDFKLKNYNIDFTGFIYDDINGLLGLDILMDGGFIIDLKDLTIKKK